MTIFSLGACQCSACRTSDMPTAEQARGGRAWALSRMAEAGLLVLGSIL